jgi:outer membrane protein
MTHRASRAAATARALVVIPRCGSAVRSLAAALALLLALCAVPPAARANVTPLVDILTEPGSAGLGLLLRIQQSPYVGTGLRYDAVPLYLYEGDRLFLEGPRAGIKLITTPRHRLDAIVNYRFEGFPSPDIPASLAGMEIREPSGDIGLAYRYFARWGTLHGELLHDAFAVHGGSEARLGYSYDWRRGRWTLRPSAFLGLRSSKLNDYYYGVRPEEALPTRPAYAPGSGLSAWVGIYGAYQLSDGWRLIAGGGVTVLDRDIADSPIVKTNVLPTGFVGAAYDFGTYKKPPGDHSPLYVKALYGLASDCRLTEIITFQCFSANTADDTSVAAVEVGKPFAEQVNGWPLDFVGYLSVLRHFENGRQEDLWQFNAYIKGFWYGLPWNHRVKTRIGLGAGFSYAEDIPWTELQEQSQNGGSTSKLLNYLDPTIDFSVGDLFRVKRLEETYFGVGVSHRSGLFGTSQLFNNVNGGSNYIYLYFETKL